jgi:hypothetical protein
MDRPRILKGLVSNSEARCHFLLSIQANDGLVPEIRWWPLLSTDLIHVLPNLNKQDAFWAPYHKSKMQNEVEYITLHQAEGDWNK